MKKILISIVCVFLLAMSVVPVLAAGSMTLTASSTSVHRSGTFTVSVNVSGVGEYRRGGIKVSFDESKFELVEGKWNLSNVSFSEFEKADKTGSYVLANPTKLSGKIFVFTFKAKSNAEFNKASDISVELTLGSGEEVITKSVKVTVTCNHAYSAWASASADKHSRKCSICGTVDTKAHTYDNPCDVDCNDCGATRVTEHSFAEEWLSDETGHWHICIHCQEKSTLEEHVPGAPAGEYTDQICTVCQEILVPALGHQHSYDGTYKTDGTFHWTKCLGCGEETEKVTHGYEGDCDETCDACGYIRAVVHKTSDNWTCDGVKHWKTCTHCGVKLEEGTHVWDGGTVTLEPTGTSKGKMLYRCGLCHTEKIEDIPALQLSEALPWWLWLLIGAASGAAIVLAIQLVIGLVKSPHKGKYSG